MSIAFRTHVRRMTTKDIVISQCLEIAALFLLPFLVACMSTTEEFIQGLWYYDNVKRLTNPGAYHVPYEDWEEFFSMAVIIAMNLAAIARLTMRAGIT